MTTAKFMIMTLCPGTDPEGPRAKKAMEKYATMFPLVVYVRIVGALSPCPKCGAKRYKMTTESQANTERMIGLETTRTRTVCEGMGTLIK